MTGEEIEEFRRHLSRILQDRNQPRIETAQKLHGLAIEVGGSEYVGVAICEIMRYLRKAGPDDRRALEEAHIAELVANIHRALETAATVEACRVANENFKLALSATQSTERTIRQAKWQFWIAAVIAFLSMLAAWVAAMSN